MTSFQAFCRGFCSAWDFTRPFSEYPEFHSQEEVRIDREQLREKLGLNKSVWQSVGDYLYKAMGDDINNHARKQ
jgi:ABC-type dipeptide/oligopeptide/nickel transport system permease component